MKKPVIFLLMAFLSLPLFSQVKFEPLSFEQALQRAKESGKLIFLQFDSETCDQCNEVADKGFENAKLAKQLEQGFVCIRMGAKHPDRDKVADLYDKENFFGSLFIGADGSLFHNYPITNSFSGEYLKQIDIALTKAGEGLRINDLEREYRNGNKSIGLAEQLLLLRQTLYLATDTLLDEYISLLPADSLQSATTLLFIARQYPVVGSKADMILRKNRDLFTKAWYSLSLADRVRINNRIIYKSVQKAIREKNLDYAYRAASFARSTHNDNARSGERTYDANILRFFRETNDTLNYLARAINFFDRYYMTVNTDSVRKRDSLNREALLAKQAPQKSQSGDSVVYKKEISYTPISQSYCRILNDGAWTFYKWTSDPAYLQKALQWSARANEFFTTPEAMDTHARLLYKTGKKNEGIEWQTKAVKLKKDRGFKAVEFEKVLAGMKTGKTSIDD